MAKRKTVAKLKPAKPKTSKPAGDDLLDRVVRLLVTLRSEADVLAACRDRLKLSDKETTAAVAEAKRRIAQAATIHRDDEFGRAVIRLNDLYERAVNVQDVKTALAITRDLNRLMGLENRPPASNPLARAIAEGRK